MFEFDSTKRQRQIFPKSLHQNENGISSAFLPCSQVHILSDLYLDNTSSLIICPECSEFHDFITFIIFTREAGLFHNRFSLEKLVSFITGFHSRSWSLIVSLPIIHNPNPLLKNVGIVFLNINNVDYEEKKFI